MIPRPFGTPQRRNVGMFALGFGNIYHLCETFEDFIFIIGISVNAYVVQGVG